VGVDTDWTESASEYANVIFTSVLKKMDIAVFDVIKAVQDGSFVGGTYVGTLANNGVGLSDINGASNELLAELADIKQGIIEGSITIP
jgi:basic membrane protein A